MRNVVPTDNLSNLHTNSEVLALLTRSYISCLGAQRRRSATLRATRSFLEAADKSRHLGPDGTKQRADQGPRRHRLHTLWATASKAPRAARAPGQPRAPSSYHPSRQDDEARQRLSRLAAPLRRPRACPWRRTLHQNAARHRAPRSAHPRRLGPRATRCRSAPRSLRELECMAGFVGTRASAPARIVRAPLPR